MIKAFEIRFLKKINSHTKNHFNTKFQWNIHRVVLNYDLKTTWFGGLHPLGKIPKKNHYVHTFIRLSSGYI